MRTIVLFDLPMETLVDQRAYRKFRRFLIDEGFIMLQKSVYSKISINTPSEKLLKQRIYEHSPKSGLVQYLAITEKQFADIEYVIGQGQEERIDSDERLVIL
ncbi:MAG: CRISPR-associated endonuclease Cas2 [Culicoidibacterales bacterium]